MFIGFLHVVAVCVLQQNDPVVFAFDETQFLAGVPLDVHRAAVLVVTSGEFELIDERGLVTDGLRLVVPLRCHVDGSVVLRQPADRRIVRVEVILAMTERLGTGVVRIAQM